MALSPKQKRIALWAGLAAAAVLAAVLVPRVFGGDAEAGRSPGGGGPGGGRGGDSLTVTVAQVRAELLEERLTTTGELDPWEAVDVRAEVAGRIVSLGFAEGAFVRQGQTLAVLDTDVLRAEVQAARTRRDLAAVQTARRRELFEIGGLSRQALDQAESELRVLEAELARLAAEIDRRRIVAPFSGQIGLREISVGAYVAPGDRIATLRQTSPLRLTFAVPERYAGRLPVGTPVRFRVPGREDDFVATVYAFESAVDPGTRAVTVRARAANPGGVLQAGSFAEVTVVFEAIENALLVPTVAVVPSADSARVYVVADGQAQPRNVATGIRTADEVQITAGLREGEVVLTSGFDEVRPGQPVRVSRGAFDPGAVRPETPERPSAFRPASGGPSGSPR
ncbi:MAG: efflux RND transporter periplasmic adaptor subunit [Rubricoccaceae bacterium]